MSAEIALTSGRTATIAAEGRAITLTRDLVTIQRKTFKQSGPSFFAPGSAR